MKELLRNPETFCRLLETTVSAFNVEDIMIRVIDDLGEFFGSDRCTLYVIDDQSNELYTKVAQKSGIGNFRVPLDRNVNLSSFVAITGRGIMVDDVYNEKELKKIDNDIAFSDDIDRKTSYRTKQMLAVPLRMRGKTIGVLQAMNKPGGFLQRDMDAMKQFSPIIALVLNHALMEQKLAARLN